MTALEKDQLMCPRRGDWNEKLLQLLVSRLCINYRVRIPICFFFHIAFSSTEGRLSFLRRFSQTDYVERD